MVQHAPPHRESEEDRVFSCTNRIHVFWHLLVLGRKKPQEHSSFPLAFVTSSGKTLFSQALIHIYFWIPCFSDDPGYCHVLFSLECFTRHVALAAVGSCHTISRELQGGKFVG